MDPHFRSLLEVARIEADVIEKLKGEDLLSLDDLKDVSEEELEKVGIMKLGQRKKLIRVQKGEVFVPPITTAVAATQTTAAAAAPCTAECPAKLIPAVMEAYVAEAVSGESMLGAPVPTTEAVYPDLPPPPAESNVFPKDVQSEKDLDEEICASIGEPNNIKPDANIRAYFFVATLEGPPHYRVGPNHWCNWKWFDNFWAVDRSFKSWTMKFRKAVMEGMSRPASAEPNGPHTLEAWQFMIALLSMIRTRRHLEVGLMRNPKVSRRIAMWRPSAASVSTVYQHFHKIYSAASDRIMHAAGRLDEALDDSVQQKRIDWSFQMPPSVRKVFKCQSCNTRHPAGTSCPQCSLAPAGIQEDKEGSPNLDGEQRLHGKRAHSP